MVQERRVLRIEGQDIWTFRVAYLRGEDDGLSLDRHLGDVYVRDDGTVIRQSLKWGNMNLRFDRLPENAEATFTTERPSVRTRSPENVSPDSERARGAA